MTSDGETQFTEQFAEMWDWIKNARDNGWIHKRRGIDMNKIPTGHILLRLSEEFGEVCMARLNKDSENTLEEIADCVSILTHFSIAQGYQHTEILARLAERTDNYTKFDTPVYGSKGEESILIAYLGGLVGRLSQAYTRDGHEDEVVVLLYSNLIGFALTFNFTSYEVLAEAMRKIQKHIVPPECMP